MTFVNPLPPWAFALLAGAALVLSWWAYRHTAIGGARKAVLVSIRLFTLLLIVVFLMRPVVRSPEADGRDAAVAVLVDTSRSMRIQDADGQRRIDRARAVVLDRVLPLLQSRFTVEAFAFGDEVRPLSPASVSAEARRSDLAAALRAMHERFQGRAVAGIVLLSDGGDTSGGAERIAAEGPPVFPIAIGSGTAGRDREVTSVTVAEAILEGSRVELAAAAVAHGHGTAPVVMRLLENGRPIEVRQVTPASEGVPVRAMFRVTPGGDAPTIYTVDVPVAAGELVPENNARSVLVQPPHRRRRVLLVEGAPGFEHSFLKRALAGDKGLEVDSVVRKGRNEQGHDTYYVQAARARSQALATGYPQKPVNLFEYDALVLANVEGAQLGRAQLEATRDFVGRRGGGLLVLGAHSFLQRGLIDTPLEEVLPLDLVARGRAVVPAVSTRGTNRVSLTPDGETHPVMQLGAEPEETRKRWDATPALAAIAPLGGPRPGASVLAVTIGAGGAPQALVAVQRYGAGRSMIFAGEAAWRWRMMLPAANRSYDTFWRQAVRWLAIAAPDQLTVSAPAATSTGDVVPLQVAARTPEYEALREAAIDLRVTAPDGTLHHVRATPESGPDTGGRYLANFRAEQAGVYRVAATAARGGRAAVTASTALLVGGVDSEMSDPRVNTPLLQRIASVSGGTVVATPGPELVDALRAAVPAAVVFARRDLWHTGWSFAIIVGLLAAEWIVRRRYGLR